MFQDQYANTLFNKLYYLLRRTLPSLRSDDPADYPQCFPLVDAVGESLRSELSEAALAAALLSREVAEGVPAPRRLVAVAPNDAECRTHLEKLSKGLPDMMSASEGERDH